MRLRVASLTDGLPLNARDTVGWDTPANAAMSNDVGLSFIGGAGSPLLAMLFSSSVSLAASIAWGKGAVNTYVLLLAFHASSAIYSHNRTRIGCEVRQSLDPCLSRGRARQGGDR